MKGEHAAAQTSKPDYFSTKLRGIARYDNKGCL